MLRPLSEPTHVFGNASTATVPIIAPMTSPDRTIAVYKLVLTASAATNITIQDTSGAALSSTIPLTGSKALILNQLDNNDPWFVTAAGLGVQIAQSGTANIGFDAYYLGGPFYTSPPSGHVAVLVPTTWNPADLLNVNLTNANLTSTNTAGGGVRGAYGASTGKFTAEYTMTAWSGAAVGVGTAAASFTAGSTAMAFCTKVSGIIINGSSPGTLGVRSTGDIIGMAVDLGAQLIWFRVAPAGNWNGSGTANPATGAGGFSISALTPPLYPIISSGSTGDIVTANFGGSAFTGAVPAGFTAGWGSVQ